MADFKALSQTSRYWIAMCAAPNGDMYAAVDYNANIYKQTGGTGDFAAVGTLTGYWRDIVATPDGDIYACVDDGDIYKQTGGTGDFNALSQTSRSWGAMCAAPNGDVYAVDADKDDLDAGLIYKQTGGTGDFNAVTVGNKYWEAICATSDGDIYACVNGGLIYKQTGGTGDFNAVTVGNKYWMDIVATPDGDIYACVSNGDIYKQTGGTGDFNAVGAGNKYWIAMCAASNGDVYACVSNGDIYYQEHGSSSFVSSGMSNKYWTDIAASPNGTIYACVQNEDIYRKGIPLSADDTFTLSEEIDSIVLNKKFNETFSLADTMQAKGTGKDWWYYNGAKVTGKIITVGVDKDYANPKLAIEYGNTVGGNILYLIDAGLYEGSIAGDVWANPTHTAYVRGLGDAASETEIAHYGANIQFENHTLYLENIYFHKSVSLSGNGSEVTDGMAGGNIYINKSIIGKEGVPSNYYPFIINYAALMDIRYTDVVRDHSYHIVNADKDFVSLYRVAYNSTWAESGTSGTYVVDNKAAIGTSGYGNTSGSLLITDWNYALQNVAYHRTFADTFTLHDSSSIDKTLNLYKIVITPFSKKMVINSSQQLGAIGYYTDGNVLDITNDVTWSSSNPSVATVDGNGLLTSYSSGLTFIKATLGETEAIVMLQDEEIETTFTEDSVFEQIPLTSDPNQTFTVTLSVDGKNITLDFRLVWNAQANYWTMTLIDSDGNYVVDSIPLTTGVQPTCNILKQYSYLKIGSCFIVDTSNTNNNYPNDSNLGTDYIMLWGDTE